MTVGRLLRICGCAAWLPKLLGAQVPPSSHTASTAPLKPTPNASFSPDTMKLPNGGLMILFGDTLVVVAGTSRKPVAYPRLTYIVTPDSVVRIAPLPRVTMDSTLSKYLRFRVENARELKRFKAIRH